MTRARRASSRQLGIILLVLCGGYVLLVIISLPRYLRERRSASWPAVTGTIVRSEPVLRSWRGQPLYVPTVEYRYSADGGVRTGHRVNFKPEQQLAVDAATRALKEYPVGRDVRVFYDAANPDESVLLPGMDWEQRVIVAMNLVCAPVALVIAILAARTVVRRRPQRLTPLERMRLDKR